MMFCVMLQNMEIVDAMTS